MTGSIEASPATRSAVRPIRLVRATTSLWLHAALLAVVISAFVAVGRPGVAFFSDEGAAVLQAQILADTGGWQYVPPLGSAGNDVDLSPFVRGDRGPEGVAPYAKHPLYPLVLSLIDPESSVALLGLSIAGTAVAAVGAALLASRMAGASRAADLTVLWLVGVGTPLLFDSALVLAHTLAAGLVVFGVLAFLRAREAPMRRAVGWALVAALLLTSAGMVRTECLFLGPALALSVLVVDRDHLRRACFLACVAGASSALAWFVDRAWSSAIVGDVIPGTASQASSGWLIDRFSGAGTTLLRTTSATLGMVDVLMWVGLVAVVVGAVALRRAGRADLLVGAGGLVALAWFGRMWIDPPALVPGLLVAFPVGVGATFLALPAPLDARRDRLVWMVVALSAMGVLLTQYGIGGGVEWGGRYFAMLLPLWVAVAVPGALGRLRSMPVAPRRALATLVVVVTLLAMVNVVAVQRHVHGVTGELLSELRDAADGLPVSGRIDGRVVVVSENRLLPQIAYTDFDRYAWVVGRPEALPRGLDGVRAADVEAVLAVTPDPVGFTERATEAGWTVTSRRPVGRSYQVLVVESSR